MELFRNRKLKGAISIFLVIITIPTMLFSAVLIDGSRMASAMAMAQEATDLAAASVLSSYDQKLKDQFGLFALDEKEQEKLETVYKESLSATLLAYGLSGDDTYSEQIWNIMKTTLTGQKSYMGEDFLNLYDFHVDGCKVEPLYQLAEQDVLASQMVEYSKFRGLYVMADRMDIFKSLGDLKAEAEKNQVTSQVMEDKMGVDEANSAADGELVKLRKEIDSLNTAIQTVKTAQANYLTSLKGKMEEIRIENIDTEEELTSSEKKAANAYGNDRSALKKAAGAACKQAGKVLDQAKKSKKEIEGSIQRLQNFQSENQGKAAGNESVADMIQDAENNIKLYKETYLPEVQKLIDDPILEQMDKDTSIGSELDHVMKDIHEAITRYIEEIERMREEMAEDGDDGGEDGEEEEEEEEITEYYYYYLNSADSTTSIDEVVSSGGVARSYQPAVSKLSAYFIDRTWDPEKVNPSNKYTGVSSDKIDQSFAKVQSGKTGYAETDVEGQAERGTVDGAVYQARPSKTWSTDTGKSSDTGFYNETNDLSASKAILDQGKHSMILDIAEAGRDDILCLTYMFGTFKTRLTGVKKFSSSGMSEKDKSSFYMPKWRYAHPDGELDMRFTPKKDRDTVLRSEIEYLIYGNQSDQANEAAVYGTIFAERLANNVVAMYGEKKVINPSCHAAAAAASLLTAGVVPEAVFFWIFLTAWATAETLLEMDYLITGGYKIPLLKTSKNILLTVDPDATGEELISHYGESGLFVSYEDYLLILLLLKGREKCIMRSADLIEMDMKKIGETDFTMADAYTYLHADTELSIRYLFGSVQPFQSEYGRNGYTGRLHFTNTIYQGY